MSPKTIFLSSDLFSDDVTDNHLATLKSHSSLHTLTPCINQSPNPEAGVF